MHSRPSIFPRLLSDGEVASEAAAAGMRAVVIKAHEGSTAERAQIASEAAGGFTVRGGIVLNRFVGGLNPVAVELALAQGAAMVWLPTIHAANHIDHYGEPGFTEQRAGYEPRRVEPIEVLDGENDLTGAAFEVLEVVAAHPGVVLNNGHLDARSTAVLFREARRLGINKLMLAHPELPVSGYGLDFQLEMVRLGAVIERCYLPHTERWGGFPIGRTASEIRQLGAHNCVLSTDLGQAAGPPPVEGLARFGAALIDEGLRPGEVETMVKHNPSALLGLER